MLRMKQNPKLIIGLRKPHLETIGNMRKWIRYLTKSWVTTLNNLEMIWRIYERIVKYNA